MPQGYIRTLPVGVVASCLFLAGGLVVLAISFQSTNRSFAPTATPSTMERPFAKMIFSEMVPGNPMYTAARAWDRMVLTATLDAEKHAARKLEYGKHRIAVADTLFNMGEHNLALETASKASIYLSESAEESRERFPAMFDQAVETLLYQNDKLMQWKDHIDDVQRGRLDRIMYHNAIVAGEIEPN